MEIVNTPSLGQANDLSSLFIGIDMRLQDTLGKQKPLFPSFATVIQTSTEVEKLPWLQLFQPMRQWQGDRVFQNYALQDLQVTNKVWESSAAIARQKILDDQYGAFLSLAIPNLAKGVAKLPDLQLAKAIEANPLTFDAVSFFSISHPIDPTGVVAGVQSNALYNLTNDTGVAGVLGGLTPANLQTARALTRTRLGPDGTPLGLMPNAIMCHPNNELAARNAATGGLIFQNNSTSAAAVSNVYQSAYEIIVNPYLTDANAWYLLCTNEAVMPFLWSERSSAEFTTIVDPQNPIVFLKDQYVIGARRVGNVFDQLGMYYYATKCTSAAS